MFIGLSKEKTILMLIFSREKKKKWMFIDVLFYFFPISEQTTCRSANWFWKFCCKKQNAHSKWSTTRASHLSHWRCIGKCIYYGQTFLNFMEFFVLFLVFSNQIFLFFSFFQKIKKKLRKIKKKITKNSKKIQKSKNLKKNALIFFVNLK